LIYFIKSFDEKRRETKKKKKKIRTFLLRLKASFLEVQAIVTTSSL
jgi:hypothetical protein